MKLKVIDVVTMAHNDHRITAENDDLKIQITLKNTIHPEHNLMDIEKGDELSDLFGMDNDSGASERIELLGNRVDELTNYLNDATAKNASLEEKLNQASNAYKKLEGVNSDLEERFGSLINEKKALKEKVEELENQLQNMQAETIEETPTSKKKK